MPTKNPSKQSGTVPIKMNKKEACRFPHSASVPNSDLEASARDKTRDLLYSENKAATRSRCLLLRKSLPPKTVNIKDFKNIAQFEQANVVFCYVSAGNEVGTHNLINQMLKQKKEVLVPLCTDKTGNMVSVKINSLDDLAEGMYGIYEPISHTPFDKTKIDVAIVPGVAFDKNGYRIGYGKGYYDKFLADISPFKIGLTHSELFFDSLPHDENDVRTDMVIKKDCED